MLKQLATLEDTAASHGRSSAALGQAGVSPELNFQEFLDRQWRFLQVGKCLCSSGCSSGGGWHSRCGWCKTRGGSSVVVHHEPPVYCL